MGGGSKVKYPGPSAQELALQQQQTALLQQQQAAIAQGMREQSLLAPYLYQQLGLSPTYDPATGEIAGFSQLPGFAEQNEALRNFQFEQTQGLLEQQRLSKLLQPFQFKAMGVTPQYDEAGKITGFIESTDPLDVQGREIARLQQERSLAALRGELPVDPALYQELGQQQELIEETLRRQLGPGYTTSTPGSETLMDFAQRRSMVLDAARRGDLTLAEQLSLARGSSNQQTEFARQALRAGVGAGAQEPNTGAYQQALMTLGGRGFGNAAQLGSLFSSINEPLGQLGQWRGQQFQAAVSKAQAKAAEMESYGKIGGSVAGAAATAGVAAAILSRRRSKRNIHALDVAEEAETLAAFIGGA
jgi:hypothetical protein